MLVTGPVNGIEMVECLYLGNGRCSCFAAPSCQHMACMPSCQLEGLKGSGCCRF
jgi:hypothetical protein